MLFLLATTPAQSLSQAFSGLNAPVLHDNADPAVTSWFTNDLWPQLLTLFTSNLSVLLLFVGIWTALLAVGFFAEHLLGMYHGSQALAAKDREEDL
jgi:hypothetical protein